MKTNEVNLKMYLWRLEMFNQIKEIAEKELKKSNLSKDGKQNLWEENLKESIDKIKTYELCFKDLFGGK